MKKTLTVLGILVAVFLTAFLALAALFLLLRLLLPRRRGPDFYLPRVGADFYLPRAHRDFYVPKVGRSFYVPKPPKQ